VIVADRLCPYAKHEKDGENTGRGGGDTAGQEKEKGRWRGWSAGAACPRSSPGTTAA
jgi:hypothetical protein